MFASFIFWGLFLTSVHDWQTIGLRYQAMVHCGNVRQAARIIDIVDRQERPATGANVQMSLSSILTDRPGTAVPGAGASASASSSNKQPSEQPAAAPPAERPASASGTDTPPQQYYNNSERSVIRTGDRAIVRFRFIQCTSLFCHICARSDFVILNIHSLFL